MSAPGPAPAGTASPTLSRRQVAAALAEISAEIDAAPDEETRAALRLRLSTTRARLNAQRFAR